MSSLLSREDVASAYELLEHIARGGGDRTRPITAAVLHSAMTAVQHSAARDTASAATLLPQEGAFTRAYLEACVDTCKPEGGDCVAALLRAMEPPGAKIRLTSVSRDMVQVLFARLGMRPVTSMEWDALLNRTSSGTAEGVVTLSDSALHASFALIKKEAVERELRQAQSLKAAADKAAAKAARASAAAPTARPLTR